jgi:hypothetical protein
MPSGTHYFCVKDLGKRSNGFVTIHVETIDYFLGCSRQEVIRKRVAEPEIEAQLTALK